MIRCEESNLHFDGKKLEELTKIFESPNEEDEDFRIIGLDQGTSKSDKGTDP